jgi:glycosyltransferase involved in cell wall biosynthesis
MDSASKFLDPEFQGGDKSPTLLVLDGSYTYARIKDLGLEQSVYVRDLDGFFRHVWSVHPFGDVSASSGSSGPLEFHEMGDRHSFVQARPGRFRLLERIFPLNFAIGQAELLWRLRGLVRRERVSLIRAGDPLYVGLLGWGLARLTGRPLMVRINVNNDRVRETTGMPVYPRLLRSASVEKMIERFVLPRADLVVAPSQDYVDFAVSNGADPKRVAIFRYGNLVAPGHLIPRSKRGTDRTLFRRLGVSPQRYLLCVSRMDALKFPDDAIRVLADVRNAGRDVKLVLAGEGPMRPELESLARQLKIADQVVFPGNLKQEALQQLYAHAAVVISPLTGRALSEAAFGSAPIVAYDLDWQSDLIHSGVTGELVPFRDSAAMADAALKLLDDGDYAQALGEAVRARAMEMLHPAKLNEHERAEYAKLLRSCG